MPVLPEYIARSNVSTELPIGVIHPRPVTATRIRFLYQLAACARGPDEISCSTPRTTSPTVFNEFRLSSGIWIENNDPAGGFSATVKSSQANSNDEYGMYAAFGVAGGDNVAQDNAYYNCHLVNCNG